MRANETSSLKTYTVRVWFATGRSYATVACLTDLEQAKSEARAYDSDSRGIEILCSDGSRIDMKPAR